MLSRVAESIYWLNRYIERAENVARLVDVNLHLLLDLPEMFDIFVGHKEALQELPPGCRNLLSSPACPHQMIRYGDNVYATQFHPEADGSVFELRIDIYRHKGYFEPHEADELIAAAHKGDPVPASKILRNFVERYG